MLRVSKSVYERNAVPPVSSADKADLLSVSFDLTFFSIDQPRRRRTAGLDDTEFIMRDRGHCSSSRGTRKESEPQNERHLF